jgi:hypothetical protein
MNFSNISSELQIEQVSVWVDKTFSILTISHNLSYETLSFFPHSITQAFLSSWATPPKREVSFQESNTYKIVVASN